VRLHDPLYVPLHILPFPRVEVNVASVKVKHARIAVYHDVIAKNLGIDCNALHGHRGGHLLIPLLAEITLG